MNAASLVDFAPLLRLLLLAAVLATLPLAWVLWRRRGQGVPAKLAGLTALALFLTFDLIVIGSFTRLSDSGLGCPDWPGCYGEASPFGAKDEIHAAQQAAPGGPVSWSKAWIEMVHRYVAKTVGALILVMTAMALWLARRERRTLPFPPGLAVATAIWVLVQGLFGAWTVTLKLYPAIVTLHLLGGQLLLALLAWQHARHLGQPFMLAAPVRGLAKATLAVLAAQIALGGWVSSNYAVLACTGFPACGGQWWPEMDPASGFTLLRGLGGLGLPALVAVHMAHRLFALVALSLLALLAWRLWSSGEASPRRHGGLLAVLLLAQFASGLSNVVLGWPLPAALAHSAGAAALVWTLVSLIARSASRAMPTPAAARVAAA